MSIYTQIKTQIELAVDDAAVPVTFAHRPQSDSIPAVTFSTGVPETLSIGSSPLRRVSLTVTTHALDQDSSESLGISILGITAHASWQTVIVENHVLNQPESIEGDEVAIYTTDTFFTIIY